MDVSILLDPAASDEDSSGDFTLNGIDLQSTQLGLRHRSVKFTAYTTRFNRSWYFVSRARFGCVLE